MIAQLRTTFCIAFFVVIASLASAQPVGAPWPMEMQDRWGTGRPLSGPDPATFTTPWIFRVIASDSRPTHAPVLDADGFGYYCGVNVGRVYKFDYTTGDVIASYSIVGSSAASAALGDNQLVYARTNAGHLFGLQNSMAASVWDTQVSYLGSPTVGPGGDVLACSSTGNAYRWNGMTGGIVWQVPGLGIVNGPVKFSRDDTKVFVASGNTMTALVYASGAQAWQRNIGNTMGNVGVAPDGTVVAGSSGGTIYGLDPDTGLNRWTVAGGSFSRVAPAFSDTGIAYFVTENTGTLLAIRSSDGVVLWTFPTGAQVIAAPIVGSDGRVYVVTRTGTLYSLSPAGAVVWQRALGTGTNAGPLSMGLTGTIYVGDTRGGLAMIRQQALTLAPLTLAVGPGFAISGGVLELVASDNARATMQPGPTLVSSMAPIQAVVSTTTAFRNLVSLKVTIESAAAQAGIQQTVELFNPTSGLYEQLGQSQLQLTDGQVSVAESVTPNRFVNATTGEIRLRLSYRATQPVLIYPWTVRTDLVQFDLVPQFG